MPKPHDIDTYAQTYNFTITSTNHVSKSYSEVAMETINEGVVVGGEESAAGHALCQLSQDGTGNGCPIVRGRTSTCRGGGWLDMRERG